LGLRRHTQWVRQTACELAAFYGLEVALADQAAAAHDIARALPGRRLLAEAHRRGLPVSRVEAQLPILLHGPVGADRARPQLGLQDPQVLEAVHWHSTASPRLSPLGQVVFLADKLDPTKVRRHSFLEEVRTLAWRDLDQAMVLFLSRDLEHLLAGGELVHPAALEARNELLLRLKGR
jgi:predicted HD superfamily hydrolase involved in NAD metabolism